MEALVSSTNKTDRDDILKVVLHTISLSPIFQTCCMSAFQYINLL